VIDCYSRATAAVISCRIDERPTPRYRRRLTVTHDLICFFPLDYLFGYSCRYHHKPGGEVVRVSPFFICLHPQFYMIYIGSQQLCAAVFGFPIFSSM